MTETMSMQRVSFNRLGKAVVLSDLHLNTFCGKFEEAQRGRIEEALKRERPNAVILNGDTVDLFFGFGKQNTNVKIATTLSQNSSLVKLLASVQKLYLLVGAHDQAIWWDESVRGQLQAGFPNCEGISAALIDEELKVVIVPGAQWYYDNVVRRGTEWLSLTKELTTAFERFLLSGELDVQSIRSLYAEGKLGVWYKTGSHYEFLQGMANIFGCQIESYFEEIAFICQGADFADWVQGQFYEEYRMAGEVSALLAEERGAALVFRALARPYWRMLGRVVNQRLNRYLTLGILDYPPYENISFDSVVVGHTHLAKTIPGNEGRRVLFTGSTKPQTSLTSAGVAHNELGGGYVVINGGEVRLEKFELVTWKTRLQMVASEHA